MISLETSLSQIRGIGPKFLVKLKHFKIETVKDLLWHFPFRYEDFSEVSKIADLVPGQQATIQGVIKDIKVRKTWKRKLLLVEAIIEDETGTISAIWFNQRFLLAILKKGKLVSLAGKVAQSKEGGISLSSPTYEFITQTQIDSDAYSDKTDNIRVDQSSNQIKSEMLRHTARIVPIYPETRGLTSKAFRYLVKPILDSIKNIPDAIPKDIVKKYGILEINSALKQIHFPERIEDAREAKKRFAFEDLFYIQLVNLREKLRLSKQKANELSIDMEYIKSLLKELPFELTQAQKKTLWEVLTDMGKPHPMNRLLQGDVGSGKTIVAILAAMAAAQNNKQTALMAPTEILASQHYRTFKKLFPDFNKGVCLATSSGAKAFYGEGLEASVKKPEILKKISAGDIKIIFGTHSLIQKGVAFGDLALVVIDEQHRFGVRQRATLVGLGSTQIETQINSDKQFLHKDLTYKIRGAIFEVYNKLGNGHKENIYGKALEEEFKIKGIKFEKEKSIPLKYNGKNIGIYRPDFIIEDKVILEIKSIPFMGKVEEKQIWSYLKGSDYNLALLINFGGKDLIIKRIVYDRNFKNPNKSEPNQSKSEFVPHFLSMSATPIPRTLTLTVFGDLNLSIINELPKGRKEIITKIVAPENRDKAYAFVRGEVKKGRQTFVICPRIDSIETQINSDVYSDKTDNIRAGLSSNLNKSELSTNTIRANPSFNLFKSELLWEAKAVKDEYEKLSKKIFPDLKVGMLHGKLKAKEKEQLMKDFKNGEIDILVSTSVVEVGVDVPNATIMMIESAERFGLAQLYQFRGRVGRGEHQSFCLLFTEFKSQTIFKRLKSLVEAKNGFELAEKDLQIRGPGEFLGQSQTGIPDLAMKALQNPNLVVEAREAAENIIKKDPELKNYPELLKQLDKFKAQVHLE